MTLLMGLFGAVFTFATVVVPQLSANVGLETPMASTISV